MHPFVGLLMVQAAVSVRLVAALPPGRHAGSTRRRPIAADAMLTPGFAMGAVSIAGSSNWAVVSTPLVYGA